MLGRRSALGALLVAALLAGSSASAAAQAPDRAPLNFQFSGVNTTLCPFPVSEIGSQTGRLLFFRDRAGELRRIQIHGTEELTFTANGRSLRVDPFPFNMTVVFDNGEIEHVYLSGLIFRADLPDGSTFLSAGRFDFEAAGVDFTVVPEVGRSGDVAALCAALSP